MKRFFKWFGIIVGVLFLLSIIEPPTIPIAQAATILLFGWIAGIFRLLFGLRHEPVAVLIGIVALLLLPVILHLFICQLPGKNRIWRFRQSLGITGIACAFIITTIALIAIIHEVYWMTHPKESLLGPMSRSRAINMQSTNNLKQLALGVHTYRDAARNMAFLPSGGTLLNDGRPGHGWMTQLLPYIEQHSLYEKIDFQKPWDDPANAELFKKDVSSSFRSWKLRNAYKDANGYQLTDYAANERVMPFGRSLRRNEITDGTSNTILCGEAVENLQPWGSPFNARDPAHGINRSPHGFGYEKPYKTVNFAMCDGSVQNFSDTIDPQILRAMATPNGGESVEF